MVHHLAFLPLLISLLLCGCGSKRTHPNQLPGALNPIGNHPLVYAFAEGRQLTLTPDTGAAQDLVIFKHTADELGLSALNHLFLNQVPIHLTYAPYDEEGFGLAHVLDAPVGEFDGLIGWPEIQRGIWQINLSERQHAFRQSVPDYVKTWKSLKILPGERILRVQTPEGLTAVIDTGASRAIHLDRKKFNQWVQQHPTSPITLYSGYSPAAKNGYFSKRCLMASNYQLGPVRFDHIMIYETFAEVAGPGQLYDIDLLIGLEAFANREIWIDGPRRRLYISPPRATSWSPGRVSLVRATFIPNKQKKLIAQVLPGGVADRAGLKTNDELVSIGGSRRITDSRLKAILSQPNKRASIVIRRQGRVRRITWRVPENF